MKLLHSLFTCMCSTRRGLGGDFARMQGGTSLIEILVSLVVLTVGLLGTARLQAVSLRAATDSGNLGMAVRVAYDVADRIRLEPAQLNTFMTSSIEDLSGHSSSACYSGTGCGGADRVRAAVAEWQRLLATQLPGGVGMVCRDATPNDGSQPADAQCSGGATDPVVVKVWWRARALQNATISSDTGVEMQRFVAIVGL